MPTIDVADFTARSFDGLFRDVMEHRHTFYWLNGGRGSTKSSFISLLVPLLLMQHPQVHAVVLRKVANTVKSSVYPQIQWGIDRLGMSTEFSYKVSPFEITYKPTGQKILFFGVDDPQKIKSLKLPFGYVGIVWFEELDAFAGMEEIRNVNQSLLRGGPRYWEFCSYNPPKSQNAWVNEETLLDDPARRVHHSTYLTVPREWLGEEFFTEAEKLRARNEAAYRHEYLGEVTGTGGSVFENVEERRISDEEMEGFDRRLYGLDFGFAVDPLAFVCMHYDRRHETLYIFDEIYQQKLTNGRAAALIRKKTTESARILADSAEPKSIREMSELGLPIRGARKWPDSVDYGIRWLQSLEKIIIDKKRCPNAYREFVSYEYERTRDGAFISAYPDKNNHAIDAVRYGCEPVMPTQAAIRAGRIDY